MASEPMDSTVATAASSASAGSAQASRSSPSAVAVALACCCGVVFGVVLGGVLSLRQRRRGLLVLLGVGFVERKHDNLDKL